MSMVGQTGGPNRFEQAGDLGAQMRLAQALENVNGRTLEQEMARTLVPGLAIALIQDNKVAVTRSFGVQDLGLGTTVKVDTMFQAASISKLVNAVAVLRLVDTGVVTLKEDVCARMGWSPPVDADVASGPISFKQLLRHSSGVHGRGTTYRIDDNNDGVFDGPFNGNGGGFGGYPSSDTALPSTLDVLNGNSADSLAVRRTYDTDGRNSYSYSGAGVTMTQYAVEQITGTTYSRWCTQEIFKAIPMNDSTFMIGPPDSYANRSGGVASGHKDNAVIAGKRNSYPESAAAGLYTTVGDLGQMIIMLNQNGKIGGKRYLSKKLVKKMMKVYKGSMLGCFPLAGHSDGFNHTGSNEGFHTAMYGYPELGAGLVVLTNGNGTYTNAAGNQVTRRIDQSIFDSVAAEFNWT